MLTDEVGEPDEVRDLFIRLQARTPLTPQQVRDAWPGNVSPYIELLAGKLSRVGRSWSTPQWTPGRHAPKSCARFMAVEAGQAYPSLGTRSLDDLGLRRLQSLRAVLARARLKYRLTQPVPFVALPFRQCVAQN